MYQRQEITTKLVALKVVRKELEKIIRIFEKYSETEEQIRHIILFVKNMPYSDSAVDFSELRKNCRLFCSYRMNATALMLDVQSRKKEIDDKMRNTKRESYHLIAVLEKAEKCLKNVKVTEQKQRKTLSALIISESGKFLELELIFKEFVELTEQVCTKELMPQEAVSEIRLLITHLDFLSDKLI